MAKRDYDRAIQDYSEVIKLDPRNYANYRSRAVAYMAKMDYDRAISDYTVSINLDPRHSANYTSRGLRLTWRSATTT